MGFCLNHAWHSQEFTILFYFDVQATHLPWWLCRFPSSKMSLQEHLPEWQALHSSIVQLSAYAAKRVAGDTNGLKDLVKQEMFAQLVSAAAGITTSVPYMQLTVAPDVHAAEEWEDSPADMIMHLSEIVPVDTEGGPVAEAYCASQCTHASTGLAGP